MADRAFVSRFSPNRTNPKVLEAIFVQRHRLADVWLEKIRDSVLTGVKHHLLAVGPRGCGKSHLVALLISRLRADPKVLKKVRIAWLPEDETTPSFWKFLLRILRALHAEYGDEFPPPPRELLARGDDAQRSSILSDHLLKKLGNRTLLVVVENLDDVMRGLKDEGQKRWRAFLQEHPVSATLATAQQLTDDLSSRKKPFFNFFEVERLQPLSADEALSLLLKLARYSENTGLVEFLQTPTGRARVRAIRHITGGSHRVFIILSEFATRDNLDNLVTAFEELLDELTPYYQERLRWLPDQQREIVEFLCRQPQTVSVKEIAAEVFLTEQTAASQLKGLRDKGYVSSASVGRESRYELSEPLMRLCVEVKDPQREPIRLIVEFLRIWYDQDSVTDRLRRLPADAHLERLYLDAAAKADKLGTPRPVEQALVQEILRAREGGDKENLVRLYLEAAATIDSVETCVQIAYELQKLRREVEAIEACDRAIQINPRYAGAWFAKGMTLKHQGRHTESINAFIYTIQIAPEQGEGSELRGLALFMLGRHAEAIEAHNQALQIESHSSHFSHLLFFTGLSSLILGRYAKAIDAFDRAIAINPADAHSWNYRGRAKLSLRPDEGASLDFKEAIRLDKNFAGAFDSMAELHVIRGDWVEVERTLGERFRISRSNQFKSEGVGHLDDLIATTLRTSIERRDIFQRVDRLVEIAASSKESLKPKTARKKKPALAGRASNEAASPPNSVALIGDALVRSLRSRAYTEVSEPLLDAWAEAWADVARRYPDLTLSVRLFGVGLKYVRTKDDRVLLDLVKEERAILRDLFRLDETEESD